MSLIAATGVCLTWNGHAVLDKIDMRISAGEIVTLVGPNGSGKSALFKVLVGAIKPDRGSIVRRRGLRIGYVPQRLTLDAAMPIRVERLLQLPHRQNAAQIDQVLATVGLPDLRRHPVASLSGGQFQRVLLARALLPEPALLLLDEPTQRLDQAGSAGFYRMIAGLRRDLGCAILMASHDLHVVMSASDRVICLNGHICCQGTPSDVSSSPEYHALFDTPAQGAMALYRHGHDHEHDRPEGRGGVDVG